MDNSPQMRKDLLSIEALFETVSNYKELKSQVLGNFHRLQLVAYLDLLRAEEGKPARVFRHWTPRRIYSEICKARFRLGRK